MSDQELAALIREIESTPSVGGEGFSDAAVYSEGATHVRAIDDQFNKWARDVAELIMSLQNQLLRCNAAKKEEIQSMLFVLQQRAQKIQSLQEQLRTCNQEKAAILQDEARGIWRTFRTAMMKDKTFRRTSGEWMLAKAAEKK